MNLVIDTNVLISSLIKDSITRRILMRSGWKFYYPITALQEIEKYEEFIQEKADLSKEEYRKLFSSISFYIAFVSIESIQGFVEKAERIIGYIDAKDVIFIATALATENDGVWSDDTHFDKQNKVKVLKTSDIVKLFQSGYRELDK